MVKNFTAKDKVVVHLLEYYEKKNKYPQPAEVTQEGIAECIESKQNTVSYAVRTLVKEGVLNERTTRVVGKRQRRKGYFLTDQGVEKARKKRKEMANERVKLNVDGEEKEVFVKDVNKYLNLNLSYIEILNRVENGGLELSVDKTEKDMIKHLVQMPKPPESDMAGTKELKRWWEGDDSTLMLVEGEEGIGKTSLLTRFIKDIEGKTNLFYFKLEEWHTPRRFLDHLSKYLTKAGEHKLSSYLEASNRLDTKEVLSNLEIDLESFSSSLIVIEDVIEGSLAKDMIINILKILEKRSSLKMIISTPSDDLSMYIPKGTFERFKMEPEDGSTYDERLEEFFEISETDTSVIDSVLNTRLTSEEILALSYISVFRESVEKNEVVDLEHVNEYTLKNLLQTPLFTSTVDGRLIVHKIPRQKLLETMVYKDRLFLHGRAFKYYHNIPVRNAVESLECVYHAVQSRKLNKAADELELNGDKILSSGYSGSLIQILIGLDIADSPERYGSIIGYFVAECYRIEGDLESSEERFKALLKRTEDMDMKSKAHEGMGDIKADLGDYKEAVREYDKAGSILEKGEDGDESHLGRIYFKIAQLFNEKGNYTETKEYLRRSIEILEDQRVYSLLTSSYFLLARIEKSRGKWEEALEHFKKGVDSWKKINESYQRVGRLHDIGSFYKVIRELSNAVKFLKETIETCEKFGYRHLKAQALLTLSECYLEEGEHEEAIETAKEAKDIFTSLGKEDEQGYVHALFGQIYLKMNEEDKAEDHISRAISIYQKLGSSYSLGLAYFSMAKLQERKGNQQGIADNYRKALVSITSSGAAEMAQKIKREMKTVPLSM